MPEVEFKNTIEWDAIVHVAKNIREPERRDFLRFYDTVEEGIMHGIHAGKSEVAFLDGEPVAIFGIADSDDHRIKLPWLALSTAVEDKPYLVIKQARRWWTRKSLFSTEVFVNLVPCEDAAAVRFLDALGFTIDYENLVQQKGADYYRFWFGKESVCA